MIDNKITDKLNREIKLKEINGKARVAFYRALGAKDAANIGVIGEYWNVMAVESIDDKPIPSIKALVDIEWTHAELEKGDAMPLIDEWLNAKAKEKESFSKEEAQSLKK